MIQVEILQQKMSTSLVLSLVRQSFELKITA